MRVWMVHVRPPGPGRPPRGLLLRDGFAMGAFLVPVVWFLANRLFALAAVVLAATVAIGALLPPAVAAALLVGLQLFIGFEARALQSWWLTLRGWQVEGVVMGRNEDAAFLTLASARPDIARLAV